MTTVYPISSAQTPTTSTSSSTSSTDSNQLNENTFLTLLVAQLKYQDPMNPADPTQFLTQTAQFTEVQTLQQMQTSEEASQNANQLLASAAMVGRPVTYSLAVNGQAAAPTPTGVISVRGTLSSDAAVGSTATASTDIYTEQGVQVPLDLDFTRTASGWTVQASSNGVALGNPTNIPFAVSGDTSNDISIPSSALDGITGTAGEWPATGIVLGFGSPTDPTRVQLASGPTTVQVAEQDGNDGENATGIVTGVHITSNGPELVIDGQDIPYSSVTDVSS